MRTIINYIRSCFCKHDWELIFNNTIVCSDNNSKYPDNHIKVYRCKNVDMKKDIKLSEEWYGRL